jgi:hypothetical protein
MLHDYVRGRHARNQSVQPTAASRALVRFYVTRGDLTTRPFRKTG